MRKHAAFIAITMLASAVFATADAAEYVVKMKFDETAGKVFFEPGVLKIKSGDTVTWVQEDNVNEHNVITYPDGIPKGTGMFESPMMRRSGEQWSRTFGKSGTYRYHCHPHEAVGMRGVVIVDRESRPDELRAMQPGEHMHGDSAPAEHGHGAGPAMGGQHHLGGSGGHHK